MSCFLISVKNVSFSHAQGLDGDFFTINSEFILSEFAEAEGEMLNSSSILFPLPSENWNLTNLELNFTDIQSKREIKDVETNPVGNKDLYKGRKGIAVQIIINEPTDIYGVHIYGYESSPITTITVTIEIRGYDSILNRPNNTIFGSTNINISGEIKWHIQNFSAPVFLNPGNYSLVMNGLNMFPADNGRYYWFFNNDPETPNLHTSEWDKDITNWSSGIIGEPLLYKLDQKIVGKFYPEDINMTADVGGVHYKVSDGAFLGTGYLNESVSFSPSDHNISIPFLHNSSIDLIFNLSYIFNLEFQSICTGLGYVKNSTSNTWTLTPVIDRFFDYQFVEFNRPTNWYNFSVFQKIGSIWENKTSEVLFDETTLLITNNSLNDDIEWMITANSPNIGFGLNLPVLEWEPEQELQFTVNAPVSEGNITFFLINPLGFGYEEPIEVRVIFVKSNLFSYVIPSNSREGSYTILIYWNNYTSAGTKSQGFQVNVPPVPPSPPNPFLIGLGIIISIGASVGGFVSYGQIKKHRIKKEEEKQKLFNKCMDVLNLDYVIVSDKKSGLNVYQQKFTEKDVDAAMISGFLQAIHSFGIELVKVEDSSQTIKLEYKNSIIIMTEFVNLRLILLMKEAPSSNFFYALEDLAYDLYKYYGSIVEDFNGDVKPFKSIEKLLKHHLNTTLIYPMQLMTIDRMQKVRINPSEKALINKAVSFMKSKNVDYFYLRTLLPKNECDPKDLETIFKLQERNFIRVME
jgi:hypothetical protein